MTLKAVDSASPLEGRLNQQCSVENRVIALLEPFAQKSDPKERASADEIPAIREGPPARFVCAHLPSLGRAGGFLRHPPMDYDEDDEELSRLEAEFHAKSAKLAFVFALIMAIGVVLVLGLRGLL
jgi:hypothetical protein